MRVSMPSLRMTIAGALSTLYLALSSVSRTKFFSTTVILSLSDAISSRICLATSPLSDPPKACVKRTSWTGMVIDGEMLLECGFVLRREQSHTRLCQVPAHGSRVRQNLKRSSKAFFAPVGSFGLLFWLSGRGGFALPGGAAAEVLAVVGDVFWRDARRNA